MARGLIKVRAFFLGLMCRGVVALSPSGPVGKPVLSRRKIERRDLYGGFGGLKETKF